MNQVNIHAEAEVDDVRYQWLVYQEEDLVRIDMWQQQHEGYWLQYPGPEERLHGGTAKGLLEETVSRWLTTSEENGSVVKRIA